MGEAVAEQSARRRILLVEDDRELRDALADALEEEGHEVIAVGDGKEALREMRSQRPDVVVLDLMMPVMDGWQFRVEQKRDPHLARTPIVAVSASSSPTAAAVDADLYIRKPVDALTLLRAIEDVLSARARLDQPAKMAQTERMAALGTLAAGVAHEINNPLTYVLLHLTHATRLLPSLASGPNRPAVEKLTTLVQGALEGVERIRGITSGIRTFSRVEELARTPLDVASVVDAALKLVQNELKHRAKLTRNYGAAPVVLANEGKLGQAFLNLLTNAIHAIPEGDALAHEIKVTIGTDSAGRASVEIADDGEGIPEHLRARIFEPFFSTKPVGQGTGLGLSITHGIVASLGGEIVLSSEVGRGSSFRVLLPAAYKSGVHTKTDPPPDERRKRVLVIDDEPAISRAIRDALGPIHEVTTTTTGRDALDLIAKDKAGFDLILCDVQMPELSGIDVYERLRVARPKLAEQMVFMTAGIFTDPVREFFRAGKRRLIHKPLDMSEVKTVLDQTKPRRRRA